MSMSRDDVCLRQKNDVYLSKEHNIVIVPYLGAVIIIWVAILCLDLGRILGRLRCPSVAEMPPNKKSQGYDWKIHVMFTYYSAIGFAFRSK